MATLADRTAMRKHARQALEVGDYRAARSLLSYLVEQDPQDKAARAMLDRIESSTGRRPIGGQRELKGRPSWVGFRSLSMIGATGLLLLLVLALLLPSGAILASRDNTTGIEPAGLPAQAAASLAALPAANVAAPLLGGQTADGGDGVPAEPPVVGQGGTCIAGVIIDRYHQAAGEGWPVTVTPEGGDPIEMLAGTDGSFLFPDLGGGVWTVELQVPDGWQPFTLASFQVTLSGTGTSCAQVRFKVEALPCLEVTKLDADGKLGFKSHVGIPDWEMTATDGGVSLTERTDGLGKAYFYGLKPGTWTVTEEEKVGWEPAPGSSLQQTISLVSPRKPGVCQTLVFVNKQVHDGCIKVRKVDALGNALSGWKITIVRDDGTQPTVSNLTDSSGYAVFKGLALGQWTVHEEVKDWWHPVGETAVPVLLEVPGRCVEVMFTNEALGCVDGYKINHLDVGLAGWEITATNDFTGETRTVTTDKNGYFQFSGLTLGSWTIAETLQTGWEAVTAPSFVVEVTQPFVCEHVRFKNKTKYACVDVYKKDYTDGSGLPGWEITVQPAFGGEPMIGLTDGTGWVRFNGLTPGTYTISEEMQDGWVPVRPESVTVPLKATGTCAIVTFENRQKTAPPPPKDPPPDPPGGKSCRVCYYVKAGDTLNSIARRYNTTVASLVSVNHLANANLIYVGQKLCIP